MGKTRPKQRPSLSPERMKNSPEGRGRAYQNLELPLRGGQLDTNSNSSVSQPRDQRRLRLDSFPKQKLLCIHAKDPKEPQ